LNHDGINDMGFGFPASLQTQEWFESIMKAEKA
jgi:hypothetical protein